MAKSRTARVSTEQLSPVQRARDAADAMFRAATECCHQHDRVSRVHAKSAVTEEVAAAQEACEHCDESLGKLAAVYAQMAGNVKPTGDDEGWWHRANALWLTSLQYLRRNKGSEQESRELADHSPDRLDALHMEYELEASALLALRHAAAAYKRDRPSAT